MGDAALSAFDKLPNLQQLSVYHEDDKITEAGKKKFRDEHPNLRFW